mmetsp:Transcript_35316/g.35970  ORF Transcript_35316/g.35970 Transcript_35316/m.35970 type:complete len:193 (+) Transcript_35316:149-727(+)
MRNRKGESVVEENESLMINMSNRNSKPTAAHLESLNPIKCGWLSKKNNSCLASVCPCFVNKWKKRYFILIGNFLFRYSSPDSDTPKGAPIPIDSATISEGTDETLFEIYTLRKLYTVRASSAQERKSWINCIRARRQIAIKEELGHAKVDSGIEFVNRVGSSMVNERINREKQEVPNPINELISPGLPYPRG